MFLYHLVIVLMVMNCSGQSLFAYEEDVAYQNAAIGYVSSEIDGDIETSADQIAANEGGENDAAMRFRIKYTTDPVEGTPPGKLRKVQCILSLARKDIRDGQTSEVRYELVELREDKALKLQDKEEAFGAELDGLGNTRVNWTIGTVGGGLMIVVGGVLLTNKNLAPVGAGMAGVGVVTAAACGTKLYKIRDRERVLRVAIRQTQTRKNDWEDSFKQRS